MSLRTSDLGYSPDHPIAVAGGRIFAGFNEGHYLLRLRAPGGEPLEFNRLGSAEGEHILDIYEVRSASLLAPVHLLFDAYAPGPDGVPEGFSLDRPDEPWSLPTSIVPADANLPADPLAPAPHVRAEPRKWRIDGSGEVTFGYADWDGAGAVSLDLPEHVGALVRDTVDHFMAITPPEYLGPVLEDVFERYLPLESRGEAKGVPATARGEPEWAGAVWGAETHERKPGKPRRRWPFRQSREVD